MKDTIRHKLLALGVALGLTHSIATAQDLPQNGPIAYAVEVPASAATIYLSGQIPDRVDAQNYGTTEQQTISVLRKIESQLKGMNLSMQNVVKMTAFLVGDPANNNAMDFAGFMKGPQRQYIPPGAFHHAGGAVGQPRLVGGN